MFDRGSSDGVGDRGVDGLPVYVDVKDAAEMLGVTERFIRRLVQERRIPFHKFGKYVRFMRSELLAWAERCHVPPLSS